jgi:hypothetical protein
VVPICVRLVALADRAFAKPGDADESIIANRKSVPGNWGGFVWIVGDSDTCGSRISLRKSACRKLLKGSRYATLSEVILRLAKLRLRRTIPGLWETGSLTFQDP